MKLPKEVVNITALSKVLAVIVLIAVFFIGFGLGAAYQEVIDIYKQQQTNLIPPTTVTRKIAPKPLLPMQVAKQEKQKIDQWIINNSNLNQYGDSKNTVYIGGTPLFNEATSERVDRYKYIIDRHPDRPWNK